MYKLFMMSLFCISTTFLNAKCASEGLTFFPRGKEIKINSIFMVEGYKEDKIINGLNTEYPIYLKLENHIVKLKILEKRIGEYGLSQVLLQPVELLKADKEYEIIIDNYPVDEPFKKKKSQGFNRWKVINKKDITKPMFESLPKEVKKISEMYGCGPEVSVNFKLKVNEESEYLVKTTIRNIKTNEKSTYYLTVLNGEIEVGHNMCSGAFDLKYDDNYEATFSIIDASGNENSQNSKIIIFKSPKSPN